MNMIRCSSGHFIISAENFRKLEAKHGAMADMWCKGCADWVPVDTHQNMVAAGHA